jgi:hypothetical protein
LLFHLLVNQVILQISSWNYYLNYVGDIQTKLLIKLNT